MRAAIYSRVSVDDDAASTVDAQAVICREYAAAQKWPIVAEYVDDGISGTAVGNRPGFLTMQDAAKARTFDVLLVTDANRIARGEDLPVILKRLKFNRVRTIGVIDRSDSNADSATIVAQAQAIFGALTVQQSREKTHAHLAIRAKLGKHTGGAVYGYQRRGVPDGDYFRRAIDNQQAEIVREIFERYASGESQRSIAKSLNARGIPSPGAAWARKKRTTSGLWQVSALHAMLHNSIYVGRQIWNATRSNKDPDGGGREFEARDKAEWIVAADERLRIVSDEMWERVRVRDTPATYGSHQARPKYMLSGLLVCGTCKSPMTLCGGTNSRGYGAQRYVCSTYRQHGSLGCANRIGVSRAVAEELIINPMREKLNSDPKFLRAVSQLNNPADPEKFQKCVGTPGEKGVIPFSGRGVAESAEKAIAAIRLAVSAGAMTEREAAPAIARHRATIERANMSEQPMDEASLIANAERLRAALATAAIDVIRDALRRVLGTVHCVPEDGELWAYFDGADAELIHWLGLKLTSKKGRSALVAGAGFEPATFGL